MNDASAVVPVKGNRFWQQDINDNWWILLVLAAFTGLCVFAVAKHQLYLDETHAWLLVRDTSPLALLKALRYEGHPALYYLLLMVPVKLHFPLVTLKIISVALAVVTVFLFLKYSPFPWYVKVLFPFSYFILYQYGVVSRSYILIPLFLFLVAVIYPKRDERLWLFVVLLGLLANSMMFGAIIAVGIYAVYLLDLYRHRFAGPKRLTKKRILASLLFGFSLLLVAPLLFRPKDVSFAIKWYFDIHRYINTSGETLRTASGSFFLPVGLIALCVSLVWFRRQRVLLLFTLPTIVMLAFFWLKMYQFWQAGICFFVWLFCLWVGFQKLKAEPAEPGLSGNGQTGRVSDWRKAVSLKNAVLACIVVVLCCQIWWTLEAITYYRKNPYSASGEVADIIKKNHIENSGIWYIGFSRGSILAYFDRNFFANLKGWPSYDECRAVGTNKEGDNPDAWLDKQTVSKILKARPPYVIQAVVYEFGMESKLPGYHLAYVLSGSFDLGGRTGLMDSWLIFVRDGAKPISRPGTLTIR